ncbi:uncharacterized protein A4U43_C01F22080 [Asparagus officinalis]|uniref:Pectinesterase inhibitor domain-containing protein n=1 Tax=Asparagus officinalis TaxID=4686 RepID=A0A5P1FR78_ASPOF|nr:uncharacterized protein LOC109837029 [Asparagus officinalis]ONK80816.1 uncharacterized protein A4U43_C01F22080 [Asparagus officinalis]
MKVFACISAAFLLLSMYSVGATLEATCKQVTSPPVHGFDFDFCKTSLQVVPGSEKADTLGLSLIAASLALANFMHNQAKATELLRDKNLSKPTRNILTDCQRFYSDDADDLKRAIEALKSGKFNLSDIKTYLVNASDDVETCIESWEDLDQKSLMPKEEDDAEKISRLALAVTALLRP